MLIYIFPYTKLIGWWVISCNKIDYDKIIEILTVVMEAQ